MGDNDDDEIKDTSYVLNIILFIYIFVLLARCFIYYYICPQTIQEINNNNELQLQEAQPLSHRRRYRGINVVILTEHQNNQMVIGDDTRDIENQLDKCSICHDLLDKHIIKTECNHKYHKYCLLNWIGAMRNQSLKCPLCMQSLSL